MHHVGLHGSLDSCPGPGNAESPQQRSSEHKRMRYQRACSPVAILRAMSRGYTIVERFAVDSTQRMQTAWLVDGHSWGAACPFSLPPSWAQMQ